jgi:hypothetical protein
MLIQISKNRLYQIGAIALVPIAVYNLFVWFANPDTKWEQQYLKAFTGGITCVILSLVLLILSCIRPDRTIILWNH